MLEVQDLAKHFAGLARNLADSLDGLVIMALVMTFSTTPIPNWLTGAAGERARVPAPSEGRP